MKPQNQVPKTNTPAACPVCLSTIATGRACHWCDGDGYAGHLRTRAALADAQQAHFGPVPATNQSSPRMGGGAPQERRRWRPADAYGQWEGLTDDDRREIAAGWAEEPAAGYRRATVQASVVTRAAGPYSLRRTIITPTLTLRGQWLRDHGLKPGTAVTVEVTPAGLLLRPLPAEAEPPQAAEPRPGYGTRTGQGRGTGFQPVLLLPDVSPVLPLLSFQFVQPINGSHFRLPELYDLLLCRTIEVVHVGQTPTILIIDEESSIPTNRRRNSLAEAVWWSHEPAAVGYPLFGRAIWCHTRQLR